MRWTDYWRIKEQVEIVEDSIRRLRHVLKYGAKEAVERETVCLKFNIEILKEFQKTSYLATMETNTSRLKVDAGRLLRDAYSYIGKTMHGGAYE